MPQCRDCPCFRLAASVCASILAITSFFALGFTPRSLRFYPVGPVMAKRRNGRGVSIITATTVSRTYTILAITSFFTFHLATGVSGRYPFAIAVAKRLYIPILHMAGIAQALSDFFAFGVTTRISESIPRIGPNVAKGSHIGCFIITTALALTVSLVITGGFTPRRNRGIPASHQMAEGRNFTSFRAFTAAVIAGVLASTSIFTLGSTSRRGGLDPLAPVMARRFNNTSFGVCAAITLTLTNIFAFCFATWCITSRPLTHQMAQGILTVVPGVTAICGKISKFCSMRPALIV